MKLFLVRHLWGADLSGGFGSYVDGWRKVGYCALGSSSRMVPDSDETTALTPEFGPPPYLLTMPFTEQPVADLASICDWTAERQAKRFEARLKESSLH
ncbi:MAG: hypothetical protein WB341_17275 [Terracidiphilus sp.]